MVPPPHTHTHTHKPDTHTRWCFVIFWGERARDEQKEEERTVWGTDGTMLEEEEEEQEKETKEEKRGWGREAKAMGARG